MTRSAPKHFLLLSHGQCSNLMVRSSVGSFDWEGLKVGPLKVGRELDG